jgi:hypothetical protein
MAPASVSFVAFTITMKRIGFSFSDEWAAGGFRRI